MASREKATGKGKARGKGKKERQGIGMVGGKEKEAMRVHRLLSCAFSECNDIATRFVVAESPRTGEYIGKEYCEHHADLIQYIQKTGGGKVILNRVVCVITG